MWPYRWKSSGLRSGDWVGKSADLYNQSTDQDTDKDIVLDHLSTETWSALLCCRQVRIGCVIVLLTSSKCKRRDISWAKAWQIPRVRWIIYRTIGKWSDLLIVIVTLPHINKSRRWKFLYTVPRGLSCDLEILVLLTIAGNLCLLTE